MEGGSPTAVSLSVRLSSGVSAVHVRGIALKSEIPAISEDKLISRLEKLQICPGLCERGVT